MESDILEQIGTWLQDSGVILGNGFMAIGYFFSEQGSLVLSWSAILAFLWSENLNLRRTLARPMRGQSAAGVPILQRRGQMLTLAIAVVWTLACLKIPAPVPQLGAGMWIVAAIYTFRRESDDVAWRLKWFLGLYAVAPFAFGLLVRLNLFYSSPYAWSRYLNLPVAATADSTGQLNATVLQVALTALRYGIPIAYLLYVVQRIGVLRPGSVAGRERGARRMRYRE